MSRQDDIWQNRAGEYIETSRPEGYDVLINGDNHYLNFNTLVGDTGYGFRDNDGVLEIKNTGEEWATLRSITLSATPPADPYLYQLWYDIS